MSLKDKLNGKSFEDNSASRKKKSIKRKPKSKKQSKGVKKCLPETIHESILDSNTVKMLEDIMMCESPPSKLKHTDDIDNMCDILYNYLGEWLKSYALVGYTYNGKLIELGCAPSPMEEHALDGAIHNLYARRAALNSITIKNQIQNFLNPNNDEQY